MLLLHGLPSVYCGSFFDFKWPIQYSFLSYWPLVPTYWTLHFLSMPCFCTKLIIFFFYQPESCMMLLIHPQSKNPLTYPWFVSLESGFLCSSWISFASRLWIFGPISSVQFSRSVVSDSLRPHEPQHARPPCPSPIPRVPPNPCPSSWWCHPAISSSVVPFSSCPQSFPASGSFPMSQLFTTGGQSIGVSASASVPPMNSQDWSPLGWTGWISLQSSVGLSRVLSNTTVQKHQFFGAQPSSQSNSHIHTWPLEKP